MLDDAVRSGLVVGVESELIGEFGLGTTFMSDSSDEGMTGASGIDGSLMLDDAVRSGLVVGFRPRTLLFKSEGTAFCSSVLFGLIFLS